MNELCILPSQTGRITVEVVSIARVRARIGVLPESVVTNQMNMFHEFSFPGWKLGHSRPSSRDSSDARRVVGDPQGVSATEVGAVARAGGPPIRGGVDD